ncbi:MAG TPA: ribonuclease P protein component [Bacteroidales bacterium]|nr:ribonuclease P protein component [Bacteroidales bacterium]
MQINASSQPLLPEGEAENTSLKYTFSKAEKLCSTKIITGLFESGNIFHTSLFKVVWMYSPVKLPFPAQVAFSVAKRSFRHAVSRNLAKRRMREAYRKNKQLLYKHLAAIDRQIVFTIILKGEVIPDYPTLEKAVTGMISRFVNLTTGDLQKC